MKRKSIAINGAVLVTLSGSPLGCYGAVLNVDGAVACDDVAGNPYCHIAAAIAAADDGDVIEIAAGTYAEQLTIDVSVELLGAGAGLTIIDGGGGRPITVQSGEAAQLNSLSVENGAAADGAGIYVPSGGTLSVIDSEVTGNSATNLGGGIYSAGTLTVEGSRVTANASSSWGGGVMVAAGVANIANSAVDANTAANGGGIYNHNTAILGIANSTISDNSSSGQGGGIYSTATATITNATIAGNVTGAVSGGGIVTGNFGGAPGTTSLQNTLLAGNTGSGGSARDCSTDLGTVVSIGHNFIGTTTGCTIAATSGDLFNLGVTAARLDVLADNGGLTPTRALLSGSAAIDAGAGCLARDQRDVRRPLDGDGDGTAACDIGAFEAPAAGGGDDGGSSGGGGGIGALWNLLFALWAALRWHAAARREPS